jgi:hypothetical protein
MALTTDARDEICLYLQMANLPAFPSVPETVTLPSIVILPDDPYAEIDRIGPTLKYTTFLTLNIVVQALDNTTGLANAEALIDATLKALPPGVRVTRVSRPLMDDLGAQGSAYVAQINVAAHVEEIPPAPAGPFVPAPPGAPRPENWLLVAGDTLWQVDVWWTLSPDDGGSPITAHNVYKDGARLTKVNGNTDHVDGMLTIPVGSTADIHVTAENAIGESLPSTVVTFTPPAI